MYHRLLYLLLSSFFCYPFCTRAQVGIGPEVGLSASNLTTKAEGYNYYNQFSTGLRLGICVWLKKDDNFCVNTGLYFVQNGAMLFESRNNRTSVFALRFNAFQVPFSLVYQSDSAKHGRFFLGAGVFINQHTRCTGGVGDNKEVLKIGENEDTDDIKPLDYGVMAFAGYRVFNGLQARVQYQQGIYDIAPQKNFSMKSANISISIAYLIKR